jgi:DNA polymerase-1
MTSDIALEQRRGLRVSPLLVRTEADLKEAVAHLERWDHFVIDVETTSLSTASNEVVWVGFAVPDRVVLIPMGHPTGVMITPQVVEQRLPPEDQRRVLKSGKLSEAKVRTVVPAVYEDPGPQLRPDIAMAGLEPLLFSDRLKVNHNLKFDLESLTKYFGATPPGPYYDTLLMTHLLDESLPRYDLKSLVMDWLRVPQNPNVRAAFYENLGKKVIKEQPIDKVARYLAKDVWYTHLFRQAHDGMLRRDPALSAAFDIEMDFYPVIMDMELRGCRIDTDMLAERGDQLKAERKYLEHQIWTACGKQFPLTNNDDKRDVLFLPKKDGGQGLKPLTFTPKTHKPQLNQDTLAHYAPKNELARLMLEWSEKEKMIGTFIDGLTEKLVDGRLHTSFRQNGTVTGRLSSAGPNLQQIPRGDMIRATFVADPGHLLVVADYDQVELRAAAYLSQDKEMIRVFQEGQDIHARAAAAMLGIPLEDVTEDQRQVGKTQNFGTLFGAGTAKIQQVARCTEEQADEFIDRYYAEFSGLGAWKTKMVSDARKTIKKHKIPYTSIPPYGRKRRLPDLFAEEFRDRGRAERQVVNAVVQGFAANIMKIAMINLREALLGTPMEILLTVHDELHVQAPEHMVEEALEIVVTTMSGVTYNGAPILGNVPLTVAGGYGARWSEAK